MESDLWFPQDARVADPTAMARDGRGASWVNYGRGDDGMIVRFFWASIMDPQKSREVGRPIYEKKLYVSIFQPGEERFQAVEREVKDSDKQRWPRQWQAFSNNQQYVPEGTPIELLFPTDPHIVSILKGVGIHIVEHLSKLTAAGIDHLGMGAQDWVNRAQKYLTWAKEGVDYHAMEKLREEKDREIASLKRQMEILAQKVTEISGMPTQNALPPQQTPLPEVREWSRPPEGFIDTTEAPAQSRRA